MTEPQQQPLTARQLQSRLVAELGEGHRYSERAILDLARRDEHPLPCTKVGDGPRPRSQFDWDQVLEWLEQEAKRRGSADSDFISTTATGIRVTVAAIARETGVHRATVLKRLQSWNVRPVERRTVQGGGVDFYQLRHILDALSASARVEDPDALPAVERDAFYRSEMRKDELRKSRGELIETNDALAVLAEVVAVRRDFYDLLLDRLEHKAALGPQALELVQQEIDRARAEEESTIRDLHERLQRTAEYEEAA